MKRESIPAPAPHPELVTIVDRDNRALGVVARSTMRSQRLIHRASYILVRNQAGELFVQKRSGSKDVFPGYWDPAAGGVVQAGENYEESAQRELMEELGIAAGLSLLFDHFYDGPETRVWGRIYGCRHEGPFSLQKEEMDCGRFMGLEEIFALGPAEKVTPDGLEILRRLEQEQPAAWLQR